MPISSENFQVVIFLSELGTQCHLAKRYGHMLRNAAPGWQRATFHEHSNDRVALIDIIAWATVFLSAVGVIQRILFVGKSPGRKKSQAINDRCKALKQFLNISNLPNLSSPAVRNAWEHLDERLDDLLQSFKGGNISDIHVHEDLLPPGTTTLKMFDPVNFAIKFGNDVILLTPCLEEIDTLEELIKEGFKRLQTEKVKVWP